METELKKGKICTKRLFPFQVEEICTSNGLCNAKSTPERAVKRKMDFMTNSKDQSKKKNDLLFVFNVQTDKDTGIMWIDTLKRH
jgi:hypothetical protein